MAVSVLGILSGAVLTAAPGGHVHDLDATGPGHWIGRNETHRFQVECSPEGVRVGPLASIPPVWDWGFSISRWGAPESLRMAGQAFPAVSSGRVELLRGRASEWFVNSVKGLEHGLEIPEGDPGVPLWIDFLLSGSLVPKVGEDGGNIAFVDDQGSPILLYRDLEVIDAEGREVGARWERIEGAGALAGGLRLAIEMDERPFPVRILGRIVSTKGLHRRSGTARESAVMVEPLAAPGNDLCPGAESIPGAGPFPHLSAVHDITDATTGGDPPPPSCQGNVSRSIWFKFTPGADGWYSFSLCEDSPTGTTVGDTVLAIYSAGGDCSGFSELAGGCDDDSCATQDLQSVLTDLSLTAGTTYYIVAWSYGSDPPPDPAAADIQLQVTQGNPPGPAPLHDQCSGAEAIPGDGPFPYLSSLTADIGGAGTVGDPPPPSCQPYVSRSVWYSFTPAVAGRYTFSACADAPTGTTVDDTVLALYASTGPCSGLVQMPGACDDDSCASEIAQSVITGAALTAGTTYYLVVWQYGSLAPPPQNSAVQVRVSRIVGPANDTCEASTAMAIDTPLGGTTTLAADDYQIPAGSGCFMGIGQTPSTGTGGEVVYRFTAPAAGTYSFRASGFPSTRNAVLYVAADCPAGPFPRTPGTCLSAANRNGAGSAEEVRCLGLASGQTVYIYVDENIATSGGSFTVEVNACAEETEPNNLPAPGDLACGVEGSIGSAGDADFFSLGIPAADSRLFALADGAAANSTDFDLRLTGAADTLEYDDQNNDPPFGAGAPNLAGAPVHGLAAFLRVSHYSPAGVAEPYRLYTAVQPPSDAAFNEVEPNGTPDTSTTAPGQYYSGLLSGTGDVDHFAFTAVAGELIFLGLDLDPLRNGTPFNGTLALLDATGVTLVQVNDPGATASVVPGTGSLAATTPFSPGEGIVHRVRTTGVYYAKVAASGSSTGDYLLSIAPNCRILPATDLALTQLDSPDPAPPGGSMTYLITVRNLGGHPATGVTLRDDPPAGTTLDAATPSQGTCTRSNPVFCYLGTLPAGGAATVSLSVTAPGSPGIAVNRVVVTMSAVDDQTANDTSAEPTQVGAPDRDGDGVADGTDCAPDDPAAWAVPGEATDLIFPVNPDPAYLEWSSPAAPGGTLVHYDLLRSTVPGDFSLATCVATGLLVTGTRDPASPVPILYYLVRARNTCGGSLGAGSDGMPRTGADCR